MRAELEQVQRIEEYLLNKMSAEDKAVFEADMAKDPKLQKEVEAQKTVMNAIKRVGVKTAAVDAYSGWKLRKWLLRGGIAIGIIGLAFLTYNLWPVAEEDDCVPCPPKTEQSMHEDAAETRINCCEETFVVEEDMVIDTAETEEFIEEEGDSIQSVNYLDYSEGVDQLLGEDESSSHNSNEDVEIDNNGEQLKDFPSTDIRITDKNDEANNDPIYVNQITDFEPGFPGGETAMYNWITKQLEYPQSAVDNNEQGIVYVQFIVNQDGSLSSEKIKQSVSKSIDNEALRVVRKMPHWNPAVKDGKAVRYLYTLPINFKLQ